MGPLLSDTTQPGESALCFSEPGGALSLEQTHHRNLGSAGSRINTCLPTSCFEGPGLFLREDRGQCQTLLENSLGDVSTNGKVLDGEMAGSNQQLTPQCHSATQGYKALSLLLT